ncbi:MAG: 3-oxoacyl-ACP synthase [Desulfobacterales bacterium]|nr:MAG: 3-oxoacyl-ACP synthase [Desulfobacterales bacterium]
MGSRIFITAAGVVSAVGEGLDRLTASLFAGESGIGPLSVFPDVLGLPVGEVRTMKEPENDQGGAVFPRTHRLALTALGELRKNPNLPPNLTVDAVVIGGTTGGMLSTESLLGGRSLLSLNSAGDVSGSFAKILEEAPDEINAAAFRFHGVHTVSEMLAELLGCRGPVLSVSTACSSGIGAFALALAMMRRMGFRRVLTGGADSLCRLTCHGFHSLRLVSSKGARPFDAHRDGMSVSEGAGLFLLEAARSVPDHALAECLGAGLSCDAHHPTAPHPEGAGAAAAMKAALNDAGLSPEAVDYISLHGTGTRDNDLSEGRAVTALFGRKTPKASSIKGSLGHSLAAAGAIEAVVSAACLREGFLPANTGMNSPDPEIGFSPLTIPGRFPVKTILSNALGFGGNNAAMVLGAVPAGEPPADGDKGPRSISALPQTDQSSFPPTLSVLAAACLTGGGDLAETLSALEREGHCSGVCPEKSLLRGLDIRTVRRAKRLTRMALGLAAAAVGTAEKPSAVFWGTGWGSLSETHDFLARLEESGNRFSSPSDFIGSVHNAPASALALEYGITGPNLTVTGGDASFEQALLSAALLGPDAPFLTLAADEAHPVFTPLFDPAAAMAETLADGGGAFLVHRGSVPGAPGIRPLFVSCGSDEMAVNRMIGAVGGQDVILDRYGAVLAGIPAHQRTEGMIRLSVFLKETGWKRPVVDYRRFTGDFASASAAAAALGVFFVQAGSLPASLANDADPDLGGKGILLLNFSESMAAIDIIP